MRRLVLLGALMLAPVTVSAHPGGLDAQGCHHDRKNGGYHCHRAQAQPPRSNNPVPVRDQPQRLGGAVSYPNCAAARAAGAAPIKVGQPGYSPRLDRDGDGVACE